jgi:hypothetical protein
MSGFKYLTFKEISDALNAGKHVEVEGCGYNPFKIMGGRLVDMDCGEAFINEQLSGAMAGERKARIVEPKIDLWIIVTRDINGTLSTYAITREENLKQHEDYFKVRGAYIRTVKVEV